MWRRPPGAEALDPSNARVGTLTGDARHSIHDDRARNIVTAAPDGDWPRVYASIKDINDAWADYKLPTVEPVPQPEPPSTILIGRLDAALARLNNAAVQRDSAETIRAAIELSRFYHPDMPATLPVRAGGA